MDFFRREISQSFPKSQTTVAGRGGKRGVGGTHVPSRSYKFVPAVCAICYTVAIAPGQLCAIKNTSKTCFPSSKLLLRGFCLYLERGGEGGIIFLRLELRIEPIGERPPLRKLHRFDQFGQLNRWTASIAIKLLEFILPSLLFRKQVHRFDPTDLSVGGEAVEDEKRSRLKKNLSISRSTPTYDPICRFSFRLDVVRRSSSDKARRVQLANSQFIIYTLNETGIFSPVGQRNRGTINRIFYETMSAEFGPC